MRTLLFMALTLVISCTVGCKPRIAQSKAYVVGSAVPVYRKPSSREPAAYALPAGREVEILDDQIPDQVVGDRRFWFRARAGAVEGFISYDAVLLQKSLMTFRQPSRPTKGIIMASALRLRSAPGLAAPLVVTVPNGVVAEVILEGVFEVNVDDQFETWLRLRLPDGREGFAYAGYVLRVDAADERMLADYAKLEEVRKLKGHFCLRVSSPRYVRNPATGEDPTDDDAPLCGEKNEVDLLPENEGACLVVEQSARFEGETYYRVGVIEGGEGIACAGSAVAWINADQGEYTANLFQHELAAIDDPDRRKMLESIAADSNSGIVRPRTAEFSEFKTNNGESNYFLVSVSVDSGASSEKRQLLLRRSETNWTVFGDFSAHKTFVHNDVTYFITSESSRADTSYTIYASEGGDFHSVGSFGTMGSLPVISAPYIRFTGLPTEGEPEVYGDVFEARFQGKSERVLLLDGMTLREIDAAEAQ